MYTGLQKIIKARELFGVQIQQYEERLLLEETVPANGTILGKVSVGNLGHFLCTQLTGSFETLYDSGAGVPLDDGIDHIRGQLIDGANRRALFNTHIPLSLWLSPGRVKSVHDLTAPPGNSLFFPTHFEYIFTANADILLDLKNDSDFPIDIRVMFHGIRVKSKESVTGL